MSKTALQEKKPHQKFHAHNKHVPPTLPPYIAGNYNYKDKTEEIALYYGFCPVKTPTIEKDDLQKARAFLESDGHAKIVSKNHEHELECYLSVCPEEKVAILRTYATQNMISLPQPVMLYYEGPIEASGRTQAQKNSMGKERRIGLEILGTPKSMAEAILIKATLEILREEGFEDLYVDINTIGDKDSIARFTKELTAYFRKNINILPPGCRQIFKKEVFDVLECGNDVCNPINENAPKSMSFLSEASRVHFKEVLEYLEQMNIPYRINNTLVGSRKFSSHTIFHIRRISDGGENGKSDTLLAVGMRYNSLSRKIEYKKEIPAVGVTIAFKKLSKSPPKSSHKFKKPKFYFIQLGFDAKLKSLEIIETLRKAKIPAHQSLSKDKLTVQLASAEHMKIPYAIIMGQKEAIENSVIVRNMNTRFQETIKIEALPEYLRKM